MQRFILGVMKPEDGLRKLRGMESTTGIWTMRCVMIIERKNLIVIDKGNGVGHTINLQFYTVKKFGIKNIV